MHEIETLYRRWLFEVWSGDFAVADRILAPDFVGHWPGFDVHGPAGAVEQIRRSHEYFDDIRTTLDVGPVVGDGMVAAHWTFHGSYRGGIPGADAPPGTPASLVGSDVFRFADGRFAEYWVVSDAAGMMRQLSAEGGPPGS